MVLCEHRGHGKFPTEDECFLGYLKNKVSFEVILRGRKWKGKENAFTQAWG